MLVLLQDMIEEDQSYLMQHSVGNMTTDALKLTVLKHSGSRSLSWHINPRGRNVYREFVALVQKRSTSFLYKGRLAH
jgi:hypothetical protein